MRNRSHWPGRRRPARAGTSTRQHPSAHGTHGDGTAGWPGQIRATPPAWREKPARNSTSPHRSGGVTVEAVAGRVVRCRARI